MNILYYCEEYPPARNGGIGTVVKLVAEAMSKRGHRVVVAGKYWTSKGRKTVERIEGVDVVRWNKRCYNSPVLWLYSIANTQRAKNRKAELVFSKTLRLLEKVITQYSIDVVELPDYVDDFIHFNGMKVPIWKCSIPRIIRVHGSVSFLLHNLYGHPDERAIKLDRAYFSQVEAVYAVSNFSREYVKQYLCPKTEVRVIYNPIEENWLELNPATSTTSSQTILFFGKITKMKGVFSLIKAFNLIASDCPNVELKIVGSGDLKHAKSLVDPKFINRVKFIGFVPKEQIREEIDHALFCVIPSYFETFSMAAIEVLARKKALVFTCRASGRELIEDGTNGILIDPDNIEQLAEKMRLLLSNSVLRDRLAENGYKMCKSRFSTETIIPQIESYYKEVITRWKR